MVSSRIVVLVSLLVLGGEGNLGAQAPQHYRAVVDFEVGGRSSSIALVRVDALAVVGDRLYLTQAMDGQIRVLDGDGSELAVWGRRGDGPGEYDVPQWIGAVDGDIVVSDWFQERLTYLDLDGKVAATRPLPSHSSSEYWFRGPAYAAVGGRLVLLSSPMVRLPEEWEQLPAIVVGPDDEVLDSLSFRWGRRKSLVEDGRSSFAVTHAVAQGGLWAMAPGGALFVVADHPGPDEPLSVVRHDLETGAADTIPLNLPMVEVPERYVDSVESALMERYQALAERFGTRKLREAVRENQRAPAADALFVTAEGEVWLRRSNFGSEPDTWLVVSPSGRITAEVEVPHGFELMARSGQHLWAHRQDALFVSYVSRLSLVPREQ